MKTLPHFIVIHYLDLTRGNWIHKSACLSELNIGEFMVSGKADYVELDPYYFEDTEKVIEDIAFLMGILNGVASFQFIASTLKNIVDILKEMDIVDNENDFYDKIKEKINQNQINEAKLTNNEK